MHRLHDRLLHPMDRPTCGWWPRHIQRPALCGDGVAAAAASLVGSGAESLCSALSWPRCAPATAPEPGSELADGTLGRSAHASDAPPSTVACAPRDASRFSAEPVGQRCAAATRAREAEASERSNFFNFFSQLLPRHALQVSIDKELAPPPPPPQKRTYHRYTGGSGPGERLASAL